jgi:integrase
MPIEELSPAFVQVAYCPTGKKKVNFWDKALRGFVLECRESGGATYAFRYTDEGGVQRQHKIGRREDITFAQAKKAAQRLRSEVTLGENPAAKKETRKAIPTYATLAEQHLAYAKTYQKSYGSTEVNIRKHVLPRWGKVRLNDITSQDVAKWLAEKASEGLKPATVEKIRVVFGRSFELGKRWNIAGAEINPVRGVARPRFNNARQRYLSADEAQRLRLAVECSSNPQLKHIVGLLLLTGARVGELLKAKWQDVDLERRLWLIPETKTGRPRHVPLSQSAIDIIKQLPKLDGCAFLVPNLDTGRPFTTLKKGWHTARREADLPGLRIHDLRHSAASFMINGGIDLYAVGRILGHADHKSTMRYSHLANETLMRAVEAGAANLKGAWASTAA